MTLAVFPIYARKLAASGRGRLAVSVAVWLCIFGDSRAETPRERYRTPYSVSFTFLLDELVHDIERGERGDVRMQAEIPHAEWYAPATRERWKAWGPPARHFPAPAGMTQHSADWKRERAIAIGLRFVGYGYQYHHVPDWDPPAGWPWKETAVGHNGKGVDCSNFTAFIYNLGFGVRLDGDVHRQAEQREAPISNSERPVLLHRVTLPERYGERIAVLRTGDLLFIRNARQEQISHVVLWVGSIGRSPDKTPLILDSHGDTIKDSEGQAIPPGIHLRPFRESSSYNRSASHALRVFPENGR